MDLPDHIREIESAAGDASRGLPEDIFLMTTRLTPMINVDLLIKTPEGVLLTWR
jgi:colanic acid biosynthesis protein WcaH